MTTPAAKKTAVIPRNECDARDCRAWSEGPGTRRRQMDSVVVQCMLGDGRRGSTSLDAGLRISQADADVDSSGVERDGPHGTYNQTFTRVDSSDQARTTPCSTRSASRPVGTQEHGHQEARQRSTLCRSDLEPYARKRDTLFPPPPLLCSPHVSPYFPH